MWKNLSILAVLAIVIALPFVFRRAEATSDAGPGDPTLVIISPHNEAIRYEFGRAFARWHKAKYGQAVKVDWRNIGGTTEISKYLQGEYATAAKAWWTGQDKSWPTGASDAENGVVAAKVPADAKVAEVAAAYRTVDDPTKITSGVDLFFGGGQFDHANAFARGFAVEPWPAASPPPGLFSSVDADGNPIVLIPDRLAGETWRTPTMFGNAISTFGIVYNVDRLRDLGTDDEPPSSWDDLADFRYVGQVGVTDPSKSGSIAKAFEMLVHQKMHDAARAHLVANRPTTRPGESTTVDDVDARIAANEKRIDALRAERGKDYRRGEVPDDLAGYQAALEQGWLDGMALVQAIGGNARYFTDSAGKVSIDVSIGDAAVGMTIDFYGRYQAQMSRRPNGAEPMKFVSPPGGTSVSCDPITLLRGAPTRDVAVRFIQFVLSPEGQRLWAYAPGSTDAGGNPIGPEKYALRRLPIRRDFYPSSQPAIEAVHVEHKQHAVDDLTDPTIDPYQIARQFTYYRRWTDEHFGVMRELIRAMCMDSGDELRDAWRALNAGGPNAAPDAELVARFRRLPTVTLHRKDGTADEVTLTWRNAPDVRRAYDAIEYSREWTRFFRDSYRSVSSAASRVAS